MRKLNKEKLNLNYSFSLKVTSSPNFISCLVFVYIYDVRCVPFLGAIVYLAFRLSRNFIWSYLPKNVLVKNILSSFSQTLLSAVAKDPKLQTLFRLWMLLLFYLIPYINIFPPAVMKPGWRSDFTYKKHDLSHSRQWFISVRYPFVWFKICLIPVDSLVWIYFILAW